MHVTTVERKTLLEQEEISSRTWLSGNRYLLLGIWGERGPGRKNPTRTDPSPKALCPIPIWPDWWIIDYGLEPEENLTYYFNYDFNHLVCWPLFNSVTSPVSSFCLTSSSSILSLVALASADDLGCVIDRSRKGKGWVRIVQWAALVIVWLTSFFISSTG